MGFKEDLFDQIKKKLANQDRHSSTETADSGDIETYLYGAPIAKGAETAVIESLEERKNAAASIFDQAETRVRHKTEEIKNACISLKWCAPYESDDCKKDSIEYIIAINDIRSTCEREISIDYCIRDHILLAIDESLIPEQERIDKKEEFLHKTILFYLGFCKNRIKLVEQCEHVPEEFKKPLYRALEDTYQLAFRAIAKSVTLRNKDLIKKIGKDELKRLWNKGGSLREKSMQVIDAFSDAAAEYFKSESMNDQAKYNTLMHSKSMKELLEKLEQHTGLEGFASKITNYA